MIILGIDPGTRCTGYGFIQTQTQNATAIDYGCIRPPAKASSSERYLIIFESIEILMEKYRPEAVAVESQFVYKNPSSAMKLGMARGMAILAAERKKIPLFEYTPKRAKKAVAGYGAATKQQIQKMMQVLFQLSQPPPEDAADALALALCHAHSLSLNHV